MSLNAASRFVKNIECPHADLGLQRFLVANCPVQICANASLVKVRYIIGVTLEMVLDPRCVGIALIEIQLRALW